MSGNSLLLDTNIIIYALKGLDGVRPYFDSKPYISGVTGIEVLGVKDINDKEIAIREAAIEFCTIMPLTNRIKQRTIAIKKKVKIPIPDAIIAATAIEEGFTLVTADHGFKKDKRTVFGID